MTKLFFLFFSLLFITSAAHANAIEPAARLQLVRQAAQKAKLTEVGLDHRDLYGVIHAESGWVSRDGMGKNGVVSQGVAQFEPATARAVGLRNPNDAVQAVEAAARLLREAAQWSARRLQGLSLGPGEWDARLREGVSIYYNLSTRARNGWNGRNSYALPVETQQHIRNARHGALIASRLESGAPIAEAKRVRAPALPAAVVPETVKVAHAPAPLAKAASQRVSVTIAGIPNIRRIDGGLQLPQGTIQWSRGG